MLQYCNKLLYQKINSKVNDASPFQNLWNSNWQLLCTKLIIILQSSLWEIYIKISDIYNITFQKSSVIYFHLPNIFKKHLHSISQMNTTTTKMGWYLTMTYSNFWTSLALTRRPHKSPERSQGKILIPVILVWILIFSMTKWDCGII